MAVKDESLYPRTESIVLKSPRRHYKIPVRSQHWQLRSLLSAEKTNIVYFPGGNGCNHIQRLNTTTHECETVKLLTFAPRCLVAKNGWLCCGSETGEFVAIQLDDTSDNGDSSLSQTLDPDARLPLSSDGSTDHSVLSFILQARRSHKSLVAKSMKLAKDRVNCITLWFPPTMHAGPVSYTEPVAVLANNDRTVTLVSLQDFNRGDDAESLDVIRYPDFVNRAIISPDGRLLIAILDDPFLYVHERVEKPSISPSRARDKTEYQWVQKQRLLLKSQRKDDRSDSRGSFAACFSPSGAYLAVGTQHGTISIFDATALTDLSVDPLLTTFKSSRPESGPGAIRDMSFSPPPFDILAWTEDRGHIGFADMRTNYIVRQIVDINVDGDFEHINVLDRNTIDPRMLQSRNWRESTPPVSNSNTDTPRRDDAANVDILNHPLTANETLVLEAIQGDRRRRERAIQRAGSEDPGRDADAAWAFISNLRPITADTDGRRLPRNLNDNNRGMSELMSSYREQRERAQERIRNARQVPRDAAERVQTNRRPDQRWMERIGETVAAMRDRSEREDASYLNVVEILQARERATNDDHDDASLIVPLVNQVVNRWEESAIRGTLASDHGVFEVPPSPDNTAGLAWSEDGRTVFVGAQNGIYELHINTYSRKLHSSFMMR